MNITWMDYFNLLSWLILKYFGTMKSTLSMIFILIKSCILRMIRRLHILCNNFIVFLNRINSFVNTTSRACCGILMPSLMWTYFSFWILSCSTSKKSVMNCVSFSLILINISIVNWWEMLWMLFAWTIIIICSIISWSHMR